MEPEKAVLHIDMDAFFASVERNRKDIEAPIVVCVYSGRSENSGAVSTCSYDARELGIHAAMPITQAKKIAEESDKEVNFVAMDREYYRDVSDRIREQVLEKYSDKIEQASIDEAYLKLEQNTGKTDEIAEEIQKEVLNKFDLTCSIGVGPNKLVAKIASDREKPKGLTVVEEDEVAEFMQHLELSDIHGIGDKTIEKLNQMNINSVKELAEADKSMLTREFGNKLGLKLKQKAQGTDNSEVEEQDQKQITRITTLGENSHNISYIKKYFPDLADKLFEKIKNKGVGFRKVSLIVIDSDIEMSTRTKTLKSHVQSKEQIIEKGEKLLDEFMQDFNGEIRRIGLRVLDLQDVEKQSNLDQFN